LLHSLIILVLLAFAHLAVTILYPLLLAKTRLQARKKNTNRLIHSRGKEESQNPLRALQSVLKDAYERPVASTGGKAAGIPGLYQGLEMQIVKGFLNQGITFLVKGRYVYSFSARCLF
jgi:solute carrier family 25 (peroxisomal adenine nucleotide transporter), member 17